MADRIDEHTGDRLAPPELVDAVKALSQLARFLPDFCRRAYLGEVGPDQWADLSDTFQLAARVCREQVVIDVGDVRDSGGR
jgi:carbonic anhydrase